MAGSSFAASQQDEHEADRRARELFHYFQPNNPALLPYSHASTFKQVKASPNLVLTALAQLAAVKAGVQRAIISLIDRETLYVVAEASRSLNLGNNSIYDNDGDGLWMGCSRGPVAGTLCEKTINLYPTPQDKHPFFIVDDLRQHPRYCRIPCVAGAPFFRYYAGTPLMTSNGINIGSLYVVDPRPNIVLTDSRRESIGVLATAIMEYLETSRQSLESGRLMKVLSGFNSFVQEQRQVDLICEPASVAGNSSDSDRSSTPSPAPLSPPEANIDPSREDKRVLVPAGDPLQEPVPGSNSSAPEPGSPKLPNRENISSEPISTSHPSSVGKRHEAFQRAADIMRQSLSLGEEGGVAIFAVKDRFDVDEDEEEGLPGEISAVTRTAVTTWAVSARDNHNHWGREDDSDLLPAKRMSQRFLQRLVRCFCKGALWYFHRDGTAFSSDEEVNHPGSERVMDPLPTILHPRHQGALRGKDADLLRMYFPKATRIIFAPLWDPLNSGWFGACFCWSSEETRIFSPNVELGGVLGFCSSLMTEDSRIRSQEADNKKAAFIGSISHELRSPLHGILAAVEFLSEQTMANSAMPLLDTIRACSQTLLDVFEQILDFSKINSFRRRSRKGGSSLLTVNGHSATTRSGPGSLDILKVMDIVTIVEDAIESICFGANHSSFTQAGDPSALRPTGPESIGSTGHVDISLDISMQDWKFSLDSGALRRIVMNLFGNALKYTSQGSICVKMEIQKKGKTTSRDGYDTVLLTFSDTGRGISNDYLRYHLYTPFMQENPLSPGTGLGLSLVNSIVRSLKGTIRIKSQLKEGTIVKIAIPLMRPERSERIQNMDTPGGTPGSSENVIDRVKQALKKRTVSFVEPEEITSRPVASARTIRKYLTQWFDVSLQKWAPGVSADLVIADETQLHRLYGHSLSEQSILLVLHRERRPAYQKSVRLQHVCPRIEWLSLPCGPYRLARTVQACLQAQLQPLAVEKSPSPSIPGVNYAKTLIGGYASHKEQRSLPLRPAAPPLPASVTQSPKPALNSVSKLAGSSSSAKTDTQTPQDGSIPTEPTTSHLAFEETRRVLLVEDNPVNMLLLQRIIERQVPINIHKAVNGKEAVDAVRALAEGYHYIFMDISMPIMDGFEATKAIRAIETERNTSSPSRIIALTGLGSNEDISKAYDAGVDVFVTKPVSLKKVIQLIDPPESHDRKAASP
ncbi:uncharacterized protein BDW70DRAFT_156164 [Aspergillus foveolatus]|uniref:uncharacterized protein n=1 Tax=Aspergillus foveolatus TaxID=210207 RepID=UPI003CCDDEF8